MHKSPNNKTINTAICSNIETNEIKPIITHTIAKLEKISPKCTKYIALRLFAGGSYTFFRKKIGYFYLFCSYITFIYF